MNHEWGIKAVIGIDVMRNEDGAYLWRENGEMGVVKPLHNEDIQPEDLVFCIHCGGKVRDTFGTACSRVAPYGVCSVCGEVHD